MAGAVRERCRLVRPPRKLKRDGVRGCCGWPSSSEGGEGGEEVDEQLGWSSS
jgi:hypothetical protein